MSAPIAALCAVVTVFGRPLPSGHASLVPDPARPGATARSFVRFHGGGFCLDAAPGSYLLSVAPLGQAEAMDVRRVGVGKDGAKVALEFAPAAASSATARLAVRLVFPAGAAVPPEPALVMIKLDDTRLPPGAPAYAFAWTRGDEAVLDALPGPVETLEVVLSGWGVAFLSPKLEDEDAGRRLELRRGETMRVAVGLAPRATVRGVARLPGGALFRPSASERSLLRVALVSPAEDYAQSSYIGDDGSFELAAAAGLRFLDVKGEGEGFRWHGGPLRLLWLRPGETRTVDVELDARARARVRLPARTAPASGWRGKGGRFYAKERVVGLPAGENSPARFSRFVVADETPATLYRGETGAWAPWGVKMSTGAGPVEVPAGTYDFYRVELQEHPYVNAGIRVLGVRPAVKLVAGAEAELAFAPPPEEGTAGVEGLVVRARRPGLDDLREAGSIVEFHHRLAPRVDLYDEAGRLRAIAYARVTGADFRALVKALESGDVRGAEALIAVPRRFSFGGLPAGRWTAEVSAWGYAPRRVEFVLREGRVERLEPDLDRP